MQFMKIPNDTCQPVLQRVKYSCDKELTKRTCRLRRRRRQRVGRAGQPARLAPGQRVQESHRGHADPAQRVRARAAVLPRPEALVHALCGSRGARSGAATFRCTRASQFLCGRASAPPQRACTKLMVLHCLGSSLSAPPTERLCDESIVKAPPGGAPRRSRHARLLQACTPPRSQTLPAGRPGPRPPPQIGRAPQP